VSNHNCPICSFEVELKSKPGLFARCFSGRDIQRYQCPNCDCIFGPLDMLTHPDIMSTYEKMSVDRVENDVKVRTQAEIMAFNYINKVGKNGNYLNFGAGKWSQSVVQLRADGWNLDAYEPCSTASLSGIEVFSKISDLRTNFYDGIFTHDVLEHFQNPIETIKLLGTLLKTNGLQCHKSPCFSYGYEWSSWHIFYPIGRSVNILVEKSGQELVQRETDVIILRKKREI